MAKGNKVTNQKLMVITLRQFFNDNTFASLVFVIVTLSIIFVKITEIEIKIFQNSFAFAITDKEMKTLALKVLLYEIMCSIFQELKRIVFIDIFGKQIENISLMAYRNILMYENIQSDDFENGIFQNDIKIGSKGLAKLLQIMILNIFPIFIGCLILVTKYRVEFGTCFSVFVFVAFLLCAFLHCYMSNIKIRCQEEENKNIGKCQKILYEAHINYENIKCLFTQEIEMQRYHDKLKQYICGIVKHKRIDIYLTFLHRLIFSVLKYVVYYFYVTNNFDENIMKKLATLKALLDVSEKTATRTGNIYDKIKLTLLNSSFIYKYIHNKNNLSKKMAIDTLFEKIELKNLSISNDKGTLIKNLNLEIFKGDKIAIIGRNGMGKSSLCKALLKMIKFNGEIIIDYNNLEIIDIDSYRKLFSYIPQNINFFSESIYYNIIYGSENKELNDVIEICTLLKVHDFISKMPEGYFTILKDNAYFLSGGEKQKVIMARALLRNAPIMITDEPLSNLDSNSQDYIIDLLFDSYKDKTLLMILHQDKYYYKFNKFIYLEESEHIIFHNYIEYKNFILNRNST